MVLIENKAEIAGILHDITKEMPKEQQLQIIIDSGIILDNVQLHAPKLWHGMSGSIVSVMSLALTMKIYSTQ